MTKEQIIDILVHELFLQNIYRFGTLKNIYYIQDANYLYNNLVREGVIKEDSND